VRSASLPVRVSEAYDSPIKTDNTNTRSKAAPLEYLRFRSDDRVYELRKINNYVTFK
jgi:hypothetical protein